MIPRTLGFALFAALAAAATLGCDHSTTIGATGSDASYDTQSDDAGTPPDASAPDVGLVDAGSTDAGSEDAGPADVGSVDDAGQADDAGSADAGCPIACGQDCCGEGEVCFQDQCCAPACDGKQCGDDGCGGSCGACDDATEECREGQCVCRSLTDAELCQQRQQECGTFAEPDRCTLQSRTVDCGTCAAGQRCNAAFLCEACPAETDAQLCARLGALCGALTAPDLCGASRAVDCGTCAAGERCDAVAHACELCPPEPEAAFCARLGASCGPVSAPDVCGVPRTVDCGSCSPGWLCSATTQTCELCPPDTDAAFCQRNHAVCGTLTGLDACGLTRTADCGSCVFPSTCDAGHQCAACVPATDPALCQTAGLQCGGLATTDNCGASRTIAECGPCAGTERCSAAGRCELCVGESDAQLCAAGGLACGPGSFTDSCGVTRSVAECGPCVAGRACASTQQCVPANAPLNDTCLGVEPLSFNPAGVATATVDLAQANNDAASSCGTSGNDVVYAFTLSAAKNVTFQASSPTFTAWPAIFLRTSCALASSEVTCANAPMQGSPVLVELVQLAAGTYYVWVDAFHGDNGPVTLTVTLSDMAAAPANDTCANPTPLTFAANGTAHASGDTAAATDDYSGTCTAMDGGDMVYSFTLTSAADVLARVSRDATAGAFIPAVYVRSSCASTAYADERACAGTTRAGGVATAVMPNLPAGTYYVIVDSTAATVGPFTLDVVATPPIPNDTCAGAVALTFAGQSAQATGDTLFAQNDMGGTCGATQGGDLVYSFELTAASSVTARVTKDAQAPWGFHPAVYLRSTCASALPSDELACDIESYGVATATVTRLAAGTYYVIVDSTTYDTGAFTLDLSASPIPTNENCASALPLAIDPATGVGTAVGDTAGTLNDNPSSTCAWADGGDLVYSFTVPAGQTKNVLVTATPPAGSPLRPVVSVRSTCAQRSSELGCVYTDTNAGAVQLQLWQVPPGTYYLWLDSRQSFANGPFALAVTLTDPPATPPNDTCANATPLWFNPLTGHARVNGTTVNATNDYAGGCATPSAPHNGGDVVYSFTLTEQRAVTVTVQKSLSTPTFKQVVYLRSTCDDTATQLSCYWETTSGAGAIVRNTLAAGTYYVIVDGMLATYGDFTLDVAAYDLPTNDGCGGVRALSFDANGVATAMADNCSGTDSGQSKNCVGMGADLVYSYTLASEKNVTVALNPGHTAYNVLYVRTACAVQNSELGCNRQTGGGVNTLMFRNQPAGTYYVWVDADSQKCGVFDLTVSAVDPPPTARNDTCAAPEYIVIDPATGVGTASGSTQNGRSDFDGSCKTGSDADLVYGFVLTQPQAVQITVTPTAGSSLIPVLYMRRECTTPTTEMACAKATATATPVQLTFTRLVAGTYTFVVDSSTALTAGPFDLRVTLTPPATSTVANDECANATALSFDAVTHVATVTGTTVGATDDLYSLCGQGTALTGPDVVYTFTLANPASVQAKVTRATGSSSFLPAVYLRDDCANLATERGCAVHTSGVATLVAGLLPAGTYYLVVDGLSATSGGFTLDVTAAPAVDNDECAGAQALSFDVSGFATASGDSTFATSTSDGTCSGAAVGAPDLVYSMTFPSPKAVSVQVVTTASTLRPIVYARRACGDPQSTVGCAAATAAASPATLNLPLLAVGTWYLFVDGYAATSKGAFTLNVTATDPVWIPGNDTCAGAAPLTFDSITSKATVTGDTSIALDDYRGTCAGIAPDLVYTFTTAADQKVTAKVTGPAGSQPAVYLRNSCAQSDPTAEATCAAGTAGVATAVVDRLPAGTWYAFVDATSYAGIAFTLEVTLEPPVAGPTNDACVSAEVLNLTSGGGASAQVTGTTLLGQDEAQGSCAVAAAPDVVYTFTTTRAQSITATVTPASTSATFRPAVVLRPVCSDLWRTEVGCAAASAAGAAATLTVKGAPAATWYLWVDGGGTAVTSGDYTLAVSLDVPTAPANDSCAAAVPVALGTTVAGNTSNADNFYGGAGTVGGWFGGGCRVARAVASGPELVYSYTPANDGPFVVTLVPTGYNAVLYVTTSCAADPASCVAYSDVTGNNPERVIVQGVARTTYYLFADGAQNAAGPFTLSVR